jgi:hypothetical protein
MNEKKPMVTPCEPSMTPEGVRGTGEKPKFKPSDVIMVCPCLFEQCLPPPWDSLVWHCFEPPKVFTREDGTKGLAHYVAVCPSCHHSTKKRQWWSALNTYEAYYAEGQLHLADFRHFHGKAAVQFPSSHQESTNGTQGET